MINWPDRQMHRRVWTLAWPMMLSNITVPLVGLVDSAVVGHLEDPRHLGAVAVGATLFTSIYWAFGFLRMGTTGLVAQAVGRDDNRANRTLLLQGGIFALTLALLMLLLQWPLITLGLGLMGPEADVQSTSADYAFIRIYGAPAALINYVIIGWFVGNQNTRIPLYLLTLINLVNLLLDLLFVWGFGWGAQGVAIATLIAEYAGLAAGSMFVLRHLKLIGGATDAASLTKLEAYTKLVRVNRHLFIRTALLLFMFAFFTSQGARLSTEVLSANALLLNFLMLISHALDGFAHASEAGCGRYAGAKDSKGFYAAVFSAALWSILFALGLTLIFVLFGELILSLMTGIEPVYALAVEYLPWVWLLPLIAVGSYLLDGVLIGTTQTRAMQQIMIFTVVCVFLPLWWLTQELGNTGLWLSFTLAFVARGAAGLYFFLKFTRENRWFSEH
ncbi:MAG TPA: MATE family efflux transporter [Marinobacterium sp.]|nr:MATE family efflux transporter [Marinobacterium sp.]